MNMAVGSGVIVELSDNDDDDCVLESVIYNSNTKLNINICYDNIFKENSLLAEVIEKCLNLENTEGMLRVINKTLLDLYKNADSKFKSSPEFESLLKKTLIRLDRDPEHKFSHIKHLCETLRFSKFKRNVIITLDNIKPGKRKETFYTTHYERKAKRQMTDNIIDLDKYEEITTINLDLNDTDIDSPIVIDDEKENHSFQEYGDCLIDMIRDEVIHCDNEQNENSATKENTSKITDVHIEHIENLASKSIENTQQKQIPINNSDRNTDQLLVKTPDPVVSLTTGSPEKLLIPQNVSTIDLSMEEDYSHIKLQRIKNIEQQIARYKEVIAILDTEEVTDDSVYSPYVRSEKYKEKIVFLYKQLCTLTGAEATKRRNVTLTVIEGHPPGPVKRLERFLNKNIGSDGNPPFPDFNDVVKCVSLANFKDNLGWNKRQVMQEAHSLFTHCGRALQKRRQRREWSDLLSRVKAEECVGDPADHDPELLARLEANRKVAVRNETDVMERYSMMQKLPPQKMNTTVNVTQLQNPEVDPMGSCSDDSLDDYASTQINSNENNIITPNAENTHQLDNDLIVNGNSNFPEKESSFNSNLEINEFPDLVENTSSVLPRIIEGSIIGTTKESLSSQTETNKCPNLIQNGSFVMPQIITAESLSNKSVTDEFGLKIFDPKETSKRPKLNGAQLSVESNIEEFGFQCNGFNSERLNGPDNLNSDENCKDNVAKVNLESSKVKCENIEFGEVKIKPEPMEVIANLLNALGDNYTVSIQYIEDPFLVVEISDSSDEE